MIVSLPPWLVTLVVSLLVIGAVRFLSTLRIKLKRLSATFQKRKPFDELPTPPNSHWLLGHLPLLEGDFRICHHRLFRDHSNEFGQTGCWVFSTGYVSVTNFEDVRSVLNNSRTRKMVAIVRRHMDPFLGRDSILFLNDKEWRSHRSVIGRGFTPGAVKEAQQGMQKVISTLLTSLKECGVDQPVQRDIGALMKMITIDIFGQAALSRDLGCCNKLQPSPMAVAFDYLGKELSRRLLSPSSVGDFFYWIPTTRNLHYQRERKLVRDCITGLIGDRLAMPKDDRPEDVLNGILKGMEEDGKNADSSHLSETTISDIVMTLVFGGYDTTSTTLTYALYHIATIPEVEKALLAEIDHVDVTDLDSLQYCKAVVLETLRLYPPGALNERTLEKPLQLKGGVVLPANTICWIPIGTIQRMEEHFERPAEFHPERWARQGVNGAWEERFEDDNVTVMSGISKDAIAPANREAFFAFSSGGRSCPGSKFAMTEAILVLAQLVKHFSFELPPDYELIPVNVGIVQKPRDDMIMAMKWRK